MIGMIWAGLIVGTAIVVWTVAYPFAKAIDALQILTRPLCWRSKVMLLFLGAGMFLLWT